MSQSQPESNSSLVKVGLDDSSEEEEEEVGREEIIGNIDTTEGGSSSNKEEKGNTSTNTAAKTDDLTGLGLSSDEEDGIDNSTSDIQNKKATTTTTTDTNVLSEFGFNSDSEEEEEIEQRGERRRKNQSQSQSQSQSQMDDVEGKDEPVAIKSVRHITTPSFPVIPPEVEMCSIKFPPEVAIKIKEYNELNHRKEILAKMKGEKERGESESKESDFLLGPQCFVRWKYKYDQNGQKIKDSVTGKPIRISNTRLVKFTNGDMQLIVGEDRFNVNVTEVKELFLARQYDQNMNNSEIPSMTLSHRKGEEENNFSVIETCGKMTNKYSLIPDSKLYYKIREKKKRLQESRRGNAVDATRLSEGYQDPHEYTRDMIRMEDHKEKLRRRGGVNRSSTGRRPAMSSNYLEDNDEDDQYDTMNISSLKRGRDSRSRRTTSAGPRKSTNDMFEKDEDEYDDDDPFIKGSDEEDSLSGGEMEEEEEDDDLDIEERPSNRSSNVKKRNKRRRLNKRKQIASDDDDEDQEMSLSDDLSG